MRDREDARKNANFSLSDRIRMQLKDDYGVEIIDQVNGPSGWKFADGSTKKLSTSAVVPENATKKRKNETTSDDNKNDKKKSKQQKDSKDSNKQSPKKDNIKVAKKIEKVVVADGPEQIRNKAALKGILGSGGSARNVNGVMIDDIKIGQGKTAEYGNRVKVNYVGKLKSTGKVFDASTKKPFVFRLGKGEVIKGWDIGVSGMMIGGKRTLTIPPEKAYGKSGAPPTIPSNATLVFDVTLLEIL